MTAPIDLRVYGEPQPKGNKTPMGRNGAGRVILVEGKSPEARARFKNWRHAVTSAAQTWQEGHHAALLDEPVSITCTFILTKPGSLPRWRWLPHGRPDIDKLARAVLDAITGTLIKDDGRVAELVCRKVYDVAEPPGAWIRIAPLGDVERADAQPLQWAAHRSMAGVQ